MRRLSALKGKLHPRLDPILSLPDRRRAQRALAGLPDGVYSAGVDVPYYAQFASPDRVYDYIHRQFDGTNDDNWQDFGAENPADYTFWAPRVCALACLKMAVEAFYPSVQPTLWQLVNEGLAVRGYLLRDRAGNWRDEGWYVPAQMALAKQYGLQAVGRSYASSLSICAYILAGWLVAATVSPELGERHPRRGRYGGHMVLVHGFIWANGRPVRFILHNPSGRFPELQANAGIGPGRFNASFAHRFLAFRPVS